MRLPFRPRCLVFFKHQNAALIYLPRFEIRIRILFDSVCVQLALSLSLSLSLQTPTLTSLTFPSPPFFFLFSPFIYPSLLVLPFAPPPPGREGPPSLISCHVSSPSSQIVNARTHATFITVLEELSSFFPSSFFSSSSSFSSFSSSSSSLFFFLQSLID